MVMEVSMKRRTDYWWAAALLLLLFSPVVIQSQILGDMTPSNLGGRDSVTGIIYLPNRRPAGRAILVRLGKGGNDASTWTDADGKFIFSGVGNGTYTISVEAGEEFEPASQQLEVMQPRGAPRQNHYVTLQLRWKPNATPKPSVIDADLAGAPKKAQQYYRDARAAAAAGKPQIAVDKLLLAVDEYPDLAIAHSELGAQYLKLNQLEKANESLLIALKLKPGAYEPLANRGVVLVRMKKYDEGESVLREVLKIKDDSAVVHFYLGRSLVGQKRPDDAEAEFRTALNMAGKDIIEARRALANIYLQRGEDGKALSELEAYLAASPKPADEKQLRDTIQQIKDSMKGKRKP